MVCAILEYDVSKHCEEVKRLQPYPHRIPIVWSFLHIFCLLLTFTPFALFTTVFLMVPMTVVFTLTTPAVFAVLYVVTLMLSFVAAFALGGFSTGLGVVLISLFFLIPTILMGTMYRRENTALSVLTSGSLAMLGQLLVLVIILFLAGINAAGQLKKTLTESMQMMSQMMTVSMPEKTIEATITYAMQMVPLYFILFSVFYVAVTHGIARRILRRAGHHAHGLPPIQAWRLPKSLIWYYLIALVASFFLMQDTESTIAVILMNLIPLLMVIFAVQALSFLAFVADLKRWGKGAKAAMFIALVILYLALPPVPQLLALLGVFDTAMPIRERLSNRQ
jgi:uncharacterized protein YybS (DUF2232 family)